MNKRYIQTALLATTLILTACVKEEVEPLGDGSFNPEGKMRLEVAPNGSDTKVGVNGRNSYWEGGDNVRINGVTGQISVLSSITYFNATVPYPSLNECYIACSPSSLITSTMSNYSLDADDNSKRVTVNFPSVYEYRETNGHQSLKGLPLIGVQTNRSANSITFHHITASINVKVTNNRDEDIIIDSIVVARGSTTGYPLSGPCSVRIYANGPQVLNQMSNRSDSTKYARLYFNECPVVIEKPFLGSTRSKTFQIPIAPGVQITKVMVYCKSANSPSSRTFNTGTENTPPINFTFYPASMNFAWMGDPVYCIQNWDWTRNAANTSLEVNIPRKPLLGERLTYTTGSINQSSGFTQNKQYSVNVTISGNSTYVTTATDVPSYFTFDNSGTTGYILSHNAKAAYAKYTKKKVELKSSGYTSRGWQVTASETEEHFSPYSLAPAIHSNTVDARTSTHLYSTIDVVQQYGGMRRTEITGRQGTVYSMPWTGYNASGNMSLLEPGNALTPRFRLLYKEEWNWILTQRPNAASKRGWVNCNNIRGLLLLPDQWEPISGISFSSSSINVYTTTQLMAMIDNGAIFLPRTALIDQNGNDAAPNNQGCYYWTGSTDGANNAWMLVAESASDIQFVSKPRTYSAGIRYSANRFEPGYSVPFLP